MLLEISFQYFKSVQYQLFEGMIFFKNPNNGILMYFR